MDALFPGGSRILLGTLVLLGPLRPGPVLLRPLRSVCGLATLTVLAFGGLGGVLFHRCGSVGRPLAAAAASAASTPVTAAVLALAALLTGTFPDGGRRLHRFLRFKVPGDHRCDELIFLFLHIPLRPLRGDLNSLPAALAVAQDADLAVVVALLCLRGTVQADLYGLPQQVHGFYVAGTVGGLDEGFLLGHPLLSILIGVLLIFQAAHQPSAGAGDLGGIQAEVLGLGHLDGDGQEPVQKLGAAEGPPADTETAHHFGLIPDADLTQFDAGTEHAGQIPHQLPEVHPAVGGEEKDDLAAVKAGGYVHQLHFQTVIRDLLLADVEGLALFFSVVIHGAAVGVSGQPQHGA